MFIVEARLTANKKHSFITHVEFSTADKDKAEVLHRVVDILSPNIVEKMSMFGKIKLRLHILNQYGERLDTMKLSAVRNFSGDYPCFRSEV